MAGYVEGVDRNQATLFPDRLDDFVDADNPVRVVDAFVDALDLGELGFSRAVPTTMGRPGYHPAVLLKLYVYGYLNRIASSRRLERESARNVDPEIAFYKPLACALRGSCFLLAAGSMNA